MKKILTIYFVWPMICFGQFPPAANIVGTDAIHKDSSIIVNWASEVTDFQRGFQDIATGGALASFGDSTAALFEAEGNSTNVVSLGDKGSITLTFPLPIVNGTGPDFAVFENSFSHDYLELAHVEVSTDGFNFVRFPSQSLTPTDNQTGPFSSTQPEKINNLAGKYIQGFGTPFDLEELSDSTGININDIRFVRIIDVVGSIDPQYGTYDAFGNLINDPYATNFESSGFDLDGVGVIHQNELALSAGDEKTTVFEIYPNPSNGLISLVFSGEQLLTIYTLSGSIIYSNIHVAGSIDLTDLGLSSGMYLIQVGNEKRKLVLK